MLRDQIEHDGPITVERYMSLCLRHYYGSRDPLGAAGDFTTAPEISQMFGELIGLWAVEVWQALGRPDPVLLVELGPGRGTLMADALRAARLVPAFSQAARVHLVETSPALRERQRAVLSGSGRPLAWHDRLEEVPPGPAIVVANEFLDAFPVRQFVATARGWCERLVGLREERLVFGLSPEPERGLPPPGKPGDVLEWPRQAMELTRHLARRLATEGGAALLVDYGYAGPAFGDTLQAVRAQAFADPLESPGEADLTTHVDFARIAEAAEPDARVHGPLRQRDFLEALGIRARAASLMRRATPAQAAAVEAALERLTAGGPTGMGELFKVLGLSHRDLETLPGLPPRPAARS
ncbi:MAG TPA: SAM-dependent methyltransferase [Microvirga sp.]|nr:SAM-dependent methyltransferase [Microvirga sp.]